MGRSLITCVCMVYRTQWSCFPGIVYYVRMRKVESINFRFGGRSTTFCSSASSYCTFLVKYLYQIPPQYILCQWRASIQVTVNNVMFCYLTKAQSSTPFAFKTATILSCKFAACRSKPHHNPEKEFESSGLA